MSPLFHCKRDAHFLGKNQKDLHWKAFPKVQFWERPPTVPADYDYEYGETPKYDITSSTEFNMPCHVTITPRESEWKEYGIEERRDIKISVAKEVLHYGRMVNGVLTHYPDPDYGMACFVEGDYYIITNVNYEQYHANTTNWHTVVMFGNKVRNSHPEKPDLVVRDPEPPVDPIYGG